ncbi:SDR family oxidoreductase [Streptomyces noursei]|uniref:SDR family oxidoreductase n=1 Tax=Streptomyces noursei TaxID=1971 RepID=UPI001F03B9E3|nr:hypothetical protein [Streptomyces noursei]
MLLSALGVESGDPTRDPIVRMHRAAEEALRRSRLAWTFLRPGAFATNTLQWAPAMRASGTVRAPYPQAHAIRLRQHPPSGYDLLAPIDRSDSACPVASGGRRPRAEARPDDNAPRTPQTLLTPGSTAVCAQQLPRPSGRPRTHTRPSGDASLRHAPTLHTLHCTPCTPHAALPFCACRLITTYGGQHRETPYKRHHEHPRRPYRHRHRHPYRR